MKFVNVCIPSKKVIVRPNDKPWFDSKLRKFCRIRERLKHMAMKSGKVNDFKKYKDMRNKVNNMKKYAKQSFFSSLEVTLEHLRSNDKRDFGKSSNTLLKIMTVLQIFLHYVISVQMEIFLILHLTKIRLIVLITILRRYLP
jgi:hypothetical protein